MGVITNAAQRRGFKNAPGLTTPAGFRYLRPVSVRPLADLTVAKNIGGITNFTQPGCIPLIAQKGFRTLMTSDGKLVKTFTITGNHTQLNVEDLQPGIYMLRFENAENVVVKKVVIQ